MLSCSVDRIKYSIGSLVSKIDTVFLKLEATENEETMGKILDSITEVSINTIYGYTSFLENIFIAQVKGVVI